MNSIKIRRTSYGFSDQACIYCFLREDDQIGGEIRDDSPQKKGIVFAEFKAPKGSFSRLMSLYNKISPSTPSKANYALRLCHTSDTDAFMRCLDYPWNYKTESIEYQAWREILTNFTNAPVPIQLTKDPKEQSNSKIPHHSDDI